MAGDPLHAALLARLERELTTLPDKPEENAPATLAALWHLAAGEPLSAVLASAKPLPGLDDAARRRLESLVERRLQGTPLPHITGRQHFLGVEMLAGPEALIPRAETQILARAALERVRECLAAATEPPVVIDVCTGSGNIVVALATHAPGARYFASDVSAEAVELARRNAAFAGVEHAIEFRTGDLLQPFEELAGRADLIACNPPYISSPKVDALPPETGAHEPRIAFDGGPLGIRILNRLVSEAAPLLRTGGWLVFEVGEGQARGMRGRLAASRAYTEIDERTDAAGSGRVVCGRRGAEASR